MRVTSARSRRRRRAYWPTWKPCCHRPGLAAAAYVRAASAAWPVVERHPTAEEKKGGKEKGTEKESSVMLRVGAACSARGSFSSRGRFRGRRLLIPWFTVGNRRVVDRNNSAVKAISVGEMEKKKRTHGRGPRVERALNGRSRAWRRNAGMGMGAYLCQCPRGLLMTGTPCKDRG